MAAGKISNKRDLAPFLETILLEGNLDIIIGFLVLLLGGFIALVNRSLGTLIGIGIAGYFANTVLVRFTNGEQAYERGTRLRSTESNQVRSTIDAPITDEPTIAEKIKSIHRQNDFKCPFCGATVLPTDFKCKHCGSVLVATANLPKPAKWGNIEIGQSIRLKHPKQGELIASVIHRIYYGELWQSRMKSDVPWTLTGDYYVGLGLTNHMFLMNWQSRYYLLDSQQPLTDMSINRDFAPYARKFAASNQTRSVSFSYQNATWDMFDIGRFRIEFAEGDGIRVGPGAVGRFIHAKRNHDVLVVEDYQSGGSGLDMLWMGYRVEEENIQM